MLTLNGSGKRAQWRRRRGLVALGVAVVGVLVIPQAQGQSTGNPLDSGFGDGRGTVMTPVSSGSSTDVARAVAVQSDGKIVAVGSGGNASEFALVRYDFDGGLDTTFGSAGKVTTAFPSGRGSANAVALQPDGKIVAAGTSGTAGSSNFTLARYNPDGSLDPNFGANGIVTTDVLGHDDVATSLALLPDGHLVAAGKANTGSAWDFAVARYDANGSLDGSFGTDGVVTTSLGPGDSVANALALQPDGKLVVAGSIGDAKSSDFALVRYTAAGSLDPTFGSGGKVTTPVVPHSAAVYGLAIQPDGKIVAAGTSVQAGEFHAGLVRYSASGSLDKTFGSGGLAVGGLGVAYAVAVQPDGRIVAAGQGFNKRGSSYAFALNRFNRNGSKDGGFGRAGHGEATVTIGGWGMHNEAFAIALQPDDKIVAAGSAAENPSRADFAVARFLGATVSVATAGNGYGLVSSSPAGIHCGRDCSAPFEPGLVTLTARASAKSVFAGWSGDCSGKGRCMLNESTDHSVKATFSVACVVPYVAGRKLKAAERAIREAHCAVGKVVRAPSSRVAKGKVISVRPAAGKKLGPRFKIRLTVSNGPR